MAVFSMTPRSATLRIPLLAALSVTIYFFVLNSTGRITVSEGRGWDGAAYVDMLRYGLVDHASNERLRPLVVAFDRPLYWLSDRSIPGAIDAFASMNVLYMAWLSVAVLLLASAYRASLAAQLFLAINLPLCVATSKFFAYYPTLVDLGAYAVIMTAMYAVAVARKPVLSGVLAVLAAVSREFGLMVAIFGIHRETRLTRQPLRALAIYAPAVIASFGLRYFVSRLPGFGVLKPSDFRDNLQFWSDQTFIAFFFYFCLTVFGGISILIAARPAQCVRFLRREPEWLTYVAPIVGMAAVGSYDQWRYLAYALPFVVVLLAACDVEWTMANRVWSFLIATVATLVTQRPFEQIAESTYFSHWFPYYVIPSAAPDDLERLWLYWGRLMMVAAISLWLIAAPDTPRRVEAIEEPAGK
ncbi:MAG: hypothetical protein DMF87_15755, partial [Acidobacteria bacterium]